MFLKPERRAEISEALKMSGYSDNPPILNSIEFPKYLQQASEATGISITELKAFWRYVLFSVIEGSLCS
jgi:hypothetical protein